MLKYSVKKTIVQGVPAHEHFYIGGCPLTGNWIGCQVKDLNEAQLKAWYKLDSTAAGKYVQIETVPDKEEKARKPRKSKANDGNASKTAKKAKA